MESSKHAVFSAAIAHPGAMPDASTQAESAANDVALGAARISARLDRLPATKTIWQLVMLLSLGLFFELFDLMFSGYIAPGLVRSGILTSTTHGLFGTSGVASFIAALFAGLFIGTAACGFLADKFGRRAIFTYSLLWYTVANIIMAFQDTAFGLNLWRFIAGVGIGVEIVTIGTYISELVPKHIRGRASACSQAIGFCAVPVVAFLSYLLVPRQVFGIDGWRCVVFTGVVGALVVWWVRRRLPESPRWLAQQGRLNEADAVMARIEARVEQEYGKPLPPPALPEPVRTRASFRDLLVAPYRKRVAMLIIFHVFQTMGYYGFANWIPTLLIKQGITVTSSLMYASIIAIAAPLGPLLGMLIADRFERKTVIIVMAAVNVVCGLMFSQARETMLLVSLGVCLVLAGNIISFSYHAYQAELFPTSIRARAVGFVYSWSRISAMFSAFVIAWCLKEFGVNGVFVFISGAMIVVICAIAILGPKTRNVALEDIST
ncbi:Inner membrane metabolite transport protein YdjE (plasmid) [Caballeronia sp. SBC1]|uniref:MFS transporter n=1 Tax=unclassified Caballeronia TaxID=2646786 RepID=UPI0013E1B5AE|nr:MULTISPECIES: MFS transporter [unclassified Caballeronia]QIE26411.1 Inner membrane metabolite transport protein YdjE [Caballeronia sp. SBC2]QIN64272.1 Inner membrane metabolite transport protein YdjE [Caballeronia sp. SBC1]